MDNSTRQFFDESVTYHACPTCGKLNAYTIAMAGSVQKCGHCGQKIRIDKNVALDDGLEDMRPELEEYLRDVNSSKKSN